MCTYLTRLFTDTSIICKICGLRHSSLKIAVLEEQEICTGCTNHMPFIVEAGVQGR